MKNLKSIYQMKYLKYLLIIPMLFTISCDLEENPPFLDETLYQDVQSARAAFRLWVIWAWKKDNKTNN